MAVEEKERGKQSEHQLNLWTLQNASLGVLGGRPTSVIDVLYVRHPILERSLDDSCKFLTGHGVLDTPAKNIWHSKTQIAPRGMDL